MKTGASGKKIRVAVLYGGRSGEHEVSLRSSASVIQQLDSSRFEIIPVLVDKEGRWSHNGTPVALAPYPTQGNPVLTRVGGAGGEVPFDVVFPVMHGTYCEDGTIQGLFELADVPYVGCGVLASSVGMDKDVAKRLVAAAGIPVVPSLCLQVDSWKQKRDALASKIASDLGFPCFVKPANAGSSVGVHKVKSAAGLDAALNDAFRYDTKVLVEKAVSAREIELSVLEHSVSGTAPLVSIPGEVTPTHEFYSYEAKYLDENGAALMIPAPLAPEQVKAAQKIARDVFECMGCEGLSRVDLFLDKVSGAFYFNEINTLPGFTSISMYPKMWEASGIAYGELLSRLVDLALARHARRKLLVRDFHAKA